MLVDDSMIYEFYDKKISQDVVNQQTFDKWREKAEAENPKLCFCRSPT